MKGTEQIFEVDKLRVCVFRSRNEMGRQAAEDVAEKIRTLRKSKSELRMIFAAAPSQIELLENLSSREDIDWSQITAFHMDEYIGLSKDAPQGFGNFLRKYLFGGLEFGEVHYMDPEAPDPESECRRYADLIKAAPIDIICMGIGENGHIAFNDPPVADFADPVSVKVVFLDRECRQQQVNDGCFRSLGNVPLKAITITIPVFMTAASLFVVVPGPTKAGAVARTIRGPVTSSCPASVIRAHPDAMLYLDRESAGSLQKNVIPS
jgi:glucosamine-6-phosphate deaminase